MDRLHYEEMAENLRKLFRDKSVLKRDFYLFGHCNATEELADLLVGRGCKVNGILDNNICKQGTVYKGIPVVPPDKVLTADAEQTIVCIVSRAYASMTKQLKRMGYAGMIKKLVDYDPYAEYSLSKQTVREKRRRLESGIQLLERQRTKYPGQYRIYCPFSALGDVYYTMSYLPYFLNKRMIREYVVFAVGRACAEIAGMFGTKQVEALGQKDMDESIQAVLYTEDTDAYIAHHDRPYIIKLAKALYIKKVPFEIIYKCGVFGLNRDCVPYKPSNLAVYSMLNQIKTGRAVVLSPFAKSVADIDTKYWKQIIRHYKEKGYQIFTNVVGDERALEGTVRLEVGLSQLRSVVERAGTFIGIRSGLCDVIREADCRKIALYPDCYYSDTKWKVEEIFHLDTFENIVVDHNGLFERKFI
jgi:hypothetical protein